MENVIIYIIVAFAVLAGLDRIFGSRLGLGAEFEKGILTSGQLILTMAGIMYLAPTIAKLAVPVVTPIFGLIGADPAMIAGCLLACDMGGAPIAEALAESPSAAALSGIITASMLGVTISFTIPTAMVMTDSSDSVYVSRGILCGIVTCPVGIFVGGLIMGMPILSVLVNMIPIFFFSIIIAVGILKFERITVKIFCIFSKIISGVAIFGLVLSILDAFCGIRPIPDVSPISENLAVIGEIALMLAGAFPLVFVLSRLLKKPLGRLGGLLKMNETATLGLLSCLVNSLIVFKSIEKMDERGKTVNMAFAVSAAFVLGDHLAYTAAQYPTLTLPMIVGKLVSGILALLLALLITKNKSRPINEAAIADQKTVA